MSQPPPTPFHRKVESDHSGEGRRGWKEGLSLLAKLRVGAWSRLDWWLLKSREEG